MPFLVFIIYSASLDQYYIGHFESIENRLFRHKNSGSKSTKKANDWKLVYTVVFDIKYCCKWGLNNGASTVLLTAAL